MEPEGASVTDKLQDDLSARQFGARKECRRGIFQRRYGLCHELADEVMSAVLDYPLLHNTDTRPLLRAAILQRHYEGHRQSSRGVDLLEPLPLRPGAIGVMGIRWRA